MTKVRLGIVGCGVMGQVHLQYASAIQDIEVVAVADISKTAARQAAERFNVPVYYTSVEQLFNQPDIEGIILALPTHIRTELALQAFAAGKHVLLEKPAAMNAEEIELLIRAKGNLIAGCCSSRYRYYGSARFAEEWIRSGKLGDIRMIRCRNIIMARKPQQPPPLWQFKKSLNGGGILADWGVYDLDYILGITGWSIQPKTVLGRVWKIADEYEAYLAPGSDAETHASALIQCENGIVLSYERGVQVAAATEQAWQIVGSHGTLALQLLPGEGKEMVFHEASAEQGVISQVIWSGSEEWRDVHLGPLRDFASAIAENRQPITTLERSLTIMKIIDAVYRSSERGEAVIIDSPDSDRL